MPAEDPSVGAEGANRKMEEKNHRLYGRVMEAGISKPLFCRGKGLLRRLHSPLLTL